MKVKFDATFEDFVDVCKRSQESQVSWSYYVVLIFVVVACSGFIAGLLQFLFEKWTVTIAAAVAGCIAGSYSVIGSRDKTFRDHIKKQLPENSQVPTEVEITEHGVSTSCLGHTILQEWSTIERIEETADAIYFRNKFGQYCSARKRGFVSGQEISTFVGLAKSWLGKSAKHDRSDP